MLLMLEGHTCEYSESECWRSFSSQPTLKISSAVCNRTIIVVLDWQLFIVFLLSGRNAVSQVFQVFAVCVFQLQLVSTTDDSCFIPLLLAHLLLCGEKLVPNYTHRVLNYLIIKKKRHCTCTGALTEAQREERLTGQWDMPLRTTEDVNQGPAGRDASSSPFQHRR